MENEVKIQKSNNIKLIVILLILLIVAGIAFVLLLINKPWEKGNNVETTTTTTTTSTTTTTTEAVETVTITFDSNGGTPVQPITVKKGEKVTMPKTTREGYDFSCWLDENDDCPNDVATFETNKHFVANWSKTETNPKTMTVTFDSRGGSTVKPIKFTCKMGSIAFRVPENPTKDSYQFRAWEDKNGKAILNDALLTCEDITLYAVWDKANN